MAGVATLTMMPRREPALPLERVPIGIVAWGAIMNDTCGVADPAPTGASRQLEQQFLGMMSHELRTPMQSVLGYTALLLGGHHGPLTDEQRKDLRDIQVGAERIMSVFEQMLDLAAIHARELAVIQERVELGPLCAQVHETFVPQADAKGLALWLDVPSSLPAVRGDPVRIHQVLGILMDNAIKFTERGQVSLRVEALGDAAVISVQDTGIGIAPEALARIFAPFQQGDRSATRPFGGAGLGLALASELVRLMGGRLGVASAPGAGATFRLHLPGFERSRLVINRPHGAPCR